MENMLVLSCLIFLDQSHQSSKRYLFYTCLVQSNLSMQVPLWRGFVSDWNDRRNRTWLTLSKCINKRRHDNFLSKVMQIPWLLILNTFSHSWFMLLLITHVLILMNAKMSKLLKYYTGISHSHIVFPFRPC